MTHGVVVPYVTENFDGSGTDDRLCAGDGRLQSRRRRIPWGSLTPPCDLDRRQQLPCHLLTLAVELSNSGRVRKCVARSIDRSPLTGVLNLLQ